MTWKKHLKSNFYFIKVILCFAPVARFALPNMLLKVIGKNGLKNLLCDLKSNAQNLCQLFSNFMTNVVGQRENCINSNIMIFINRHFILAFFFTFSTYHTNISNLNVHPQPYV